MKTTEEIKKGLECCAMSVCDNCPYKDCESYDECTGELTADALACIKQLERERDAAIKDIPRACGYCKHYAHRKTHECHSKVPCANVSGVNTRWEWRGLCAENGGAEDA